MSTVTAIPLRLWLLPFASAVAFALLWWWALGRHRWHRRRTLRQRLAALGRGDTARPPDASASLPDTGDRQHRRWLVMGETQAACTGLLEAGGAVPMPDADTAAVWQVWTRPGMTFLALNPAVVQRQQDAAQRRAWLRGLTALVERHPARPLDGVVVCVDAAALAGGAGAALGRLSAEAAELLQLQLPVHLVVVGLERWPGHAELCAALPQDVLTQVIGHRRGAQDSANGTPGQQLDAMFVPLSRRLESLGMALLREHADAPTRLAIHRWVSQVLALQPGLHTLAAQLFAPQSGASWRGLYLTASASPHHPAAFTADLFQRFLPQDRPTARRNVGRAGA